MRVLVLGATGYLGSAVARRLRRGGHDVVPFARAGSPGAAEPGARLGDLSDPGSLRRAVTDDVDAVLNLATPTGDEAVDAAAVDALLDRLRGTGRVFVHTSGVWVLGATGDRPAHEGSATNAIDLVGYRPRIEQRVLAAASQEVRSVVIRPGIVYGDGGGIPSQLVAWAAEHGSGRYVGSPATRWPMVHVDDLAELYELVPAKSTAGGVLHGVALEAVPSAALAAAADLAAGGIGRAEPWPLEEAAEALGLPYAQALALDQTVSGARARAELGWRPGGPHPLTDLSRGSYTREAGRNGS